MFALGEYRALGRTAVSYRFHPLLISATTVLPCGYPSIYRSHSAIYFMTVNIIELQ